MRNGSWSLALPALKFSNSTIPELYVYNTISAGNIICHRNEVNSIAWLYRRAQPKDSIYYITLHYITLHYIASHHITSHHITSHVMSVKSWLDYYSSNDSNVFLCLLDISKAFDKVNKFALYQKLIDRRLPSNLIHLFISWYSVSASIVCWRGCFIQTIWTWIWCETRGGGYFSGPICYVYK